MLKKDKILGVGITSESEEKVLEYIVNRLKSISSKDDKLFIFTPNPEILVYANKHPDYKDKLNEASIALPDGIGVFLASLLYGRPFKQRITGVDFIEELCKVSVKSPLSMGFLGGKAGVAQTAADCLLQRYPHLNIAFVAEEWSDAGFKQKKVSSGGIESTKHAVPHNEIDILFVAYGFPKQEEWIYNNLQDLPVKAAMGVGGAFDYISGQVVRAPYIIRAMGMEWLFRLIRQPWRLKRQMALLEFTYLILKESLSKKH